MIKRLLKILQGKMPPPVPPPPAIDLDNIYVQLKLAMGQINEKPIHLRSGPAAGGNIESFSTTLNGLLKSLIEVNARLKEHTHIQTGLFYARRLELVDLDNFIFVEDGYYVNDYAPKMFLVLEQIDVYYSLMKDADAALYGVMEHNHRQLYAYTTSLVKFLQALIQHFG